MIGASEKPESLGGLVLCNIQEGDFRGKIWAVNRRGYANVFNAPSVSRVRDLPEVPDLAVVCTAIEGVPALIKALGEFGIKAALVLSGGAHLDRDSDSQGSIKERMLKAARASGIRLLGPECMGVIVPGKKLNASYASQPVKPGRVAYLGQSGMLANAMIDWAAGRDVGFRMSSPSATVSMCCCLTYSTTLTSTRRRRRFCCTSSISATRSIS